MTEFAEVLARHGSRVTAPRLAVWRALRAADGHATADQLAEVVHRTDPSVNLASVYRALALFARLGLARESRLGPATASRWELAHGDQRFHVVCDDCGRVEHHGGSAVESIVGHLERSHGFEVRTVDLTVLGRCADCASVANRSH